MEGPTDLFKTFLDSAKEFGKTSLELVKLQMVDKVSGAVSTAIVGSVTFFVAILFIFLLSTGVAVWLGDILNHMYYGFFIVALFYLLCGLIISILLPKVFKKQIANMIIRKILK